jgi:hypothetical protein
MFDHVVLVSPPIDVILDKIAKMTCLVTEAAYRLLPYRMALSHAV